ncbi:MAG: LLM class F420-dependent oxidoreductase [Thermoplasmata archaeon]
MREITFGAMIPQGWIYDLPEEEGPEEQYDLIVEVGRALDRLDFASGWFYDHFHPVPKPAPLSVFECWTMTTAIAALTQRLRIGQMVTANSYRNPTLLAKMAACVDVLSKGRLEFGLGAGWFEHEYRGYGYDFPSAATRIGMMDEAVQIIRQCWTEEQVHFEGKHYRLAGAYCDPKPVQEPRPPITIGGGGEQLTLRSVANWADRSNFFGDPATFLRKSRILDDHCRAVGRDPGEIERSHNRSVVIAEENKAAQERAADFAKRLQQSPEEYAARTMIGDPEGIAALLGRFLDVGVTYFVVYFPDAWEIEPIELFSREVMPRIREMAQERAS